MVQANGAEDYLNDCSVAALSTCQWLFCRNKVYLRRQPCSRSCTIPHGFSAANKLDWCDCSGKYTGATTQRGSCVPIEATAFLAAVSAFAVFLLVIFVYANKKWRLLNVGESGNEFVSVVQSGPHPHNISVLLQNKGNSPHQIAQRTTTTTTQPLDFESDDELLRRLRLKACREANFGNHRGANAVLSRESSLYDEPSHLHISENDNNVAYPLSSIPSQQEPASHASLTHQQHHPVQHYRNPQRHPLRHQRSFDLDSHHYVSLSSTYSHFNSTSFDLGPGLPTSSTYASGGAAGASGGVTNHVTRHHQQHPVSDSHHPVPRFQRSDSVSGYSYPNSSSSARATPTMSPLTKGTDSPRSYHGHPSSRISNFQGAQQTVRPLRVSSIRDTDCSRRRPHPRGLTRTKQGRSIRTDGSDSNDLISLAEKGKINGGSSASSTSSNVSADDDLRHSLLRSSTHSNPSTSSSQPNTLTSRQSSLHGSDIHQRRTIHHHALMASHSTSSGEGRRVLIPPRTKSVDSESPPPSEQGLSTYGDSIDQDDHIFEVEEMMVENDLSLSLDAERVPSSPVQCGSLEVGFDYEAAARKMTVHIIQARGVPPKDMGGANHTQVRIVLLPGRKQKHKTKVRSGQDPNFMESFVFSKINPEDVNSMGVRFRLYGCERIRRERLLGEAVLGFGSIHLEMDTTVWVNLEPKYHLKWDSRSESGSLARSDSASSTASIQSGIPELLVGLAYNGTTGRLTVEVIKGSHFRNLAGGRAPDSYVKLVLVSLNGQEMGRAKSSLRRSQSNPLFKETFMFQVALFQISEVTLLVSVYGRKGVTRRELLGWFAFGYNCSGDEETTHWEDMCDAQGDQMCRWHVLHQS